MSDKLIAAMDVGGTSIKAGAITEDGTVVDGTLVVCESHSDDNKNIILENFISIIRKVVTQAENGRGLFKALGIGFPGPFDYKNGVSYIKGIGKFDSLYGARIKTEICKRIEADPYLKGRFLDGFGIAFENDASLFALGEFFCGEVRKSERLICITIGTGIGSSFLDHGVLVREMEGIPDGGYIFNQPFRESIVDDYLSRRGIINIARQRGLQAIGLDVKDIAEMAVSGDKRALDVFGIFGNMLGEALTPYIIRFKPQALVLGGQISKSYNLFSEALRQALSETPVLIKVSVNSSLSTLVGAVRLF